MIESAAPGPLTVVSEDTTDTVLRAARHECWRVLAEPTRLSFTWPSPGEPREGRVAFPTAHPDPETPLAHFGLLVLNPETVDLLEINGHPQNRWQYHRDDSGPGDLPGRREGDYIGSESDGRKTRHR